MSRKGQGAPSKKGLFSVKSFYSVMGGYDCVCFPWKSVWQTKIPLRVAFFVWLVALGKIFTMGNDRNNMSLWLIGIAYVQGMEGPWTIFCFIVWLLAPFGMFSLFDLSCLGSFLDELSICMLVGGLLAIRRVLQCGIWCILWCL
jgi:hypothetical protein